VKGLKVIEPELGDWVIPFTLVNLSGLFAV